MTDNYLKNVIIGLTLASLGYCTGQQLKKSKTKDISSVVTPSAEPKPLNDDCLVPLTYAQTNGGNSHNLYKTPFGVEMKTARRRDTPGWIGYDKTRSLYFRSGSEMWYDQNADSKTHFFKDGYMPMGNEMACALAQEMLK